MVTHLSLSRPLIFVGPPCAGKTSIGKKIAKKCIVPFYDLDHMIEEQCGLSVRQILKQQKESYFRVLETQCLRRFYQRPKPRQFVLATGGGAMMSEVNRQMIHKIGKRIYLKSSSETVIRRMHEEDIAHPLCRTNSRDELRILLNEREKYYSQSDYTIETDGKSINTICLEIIGGIIHGTRRYKEISKDAAPKESAGKEGSSEEKRIC